MKKVCYLPSGDGHAAEPHAPAAVGRRTAPPLATLLLQVPLPLRLWFCVWPTATTLSTSPARPARCSLIW